MNVLLLRLEAPLMAFGGVAVDNLGITDPIPSASLLTGLLGNAFGYQRHQHERLQRLQDRLDYAVRVDRTGHRLTDYQTASLNKSDIGWTTRGTPEGRAGGAGTYAGQHQRYRDFHSDAAVTVALCLAESTEEPTIEQLAAALDAPSRPLFIGRKPCLPADKILLGCVVASSLISALQQAKTADDADANPALYQRMDGASGPRDLELHGLRNWQSNVHQGRQRWTTSSGESGR